MPKLKLSYSKLSVSEECELRFYHLYIMKTPYRKMDHPAARLGTAFHEAVEQWNQGGNLTIEALFTCWKHSFQDQMSKGGMRPITHLQKQSYNLQGRRIVLKFWNRQVEEGLVRKALFNEQAFFVPWETEFGTIIINGFIDRGMDKTPRGMEIEDFKTGKIEPTQKSVETDLQLTFYSAAYRWMARQSEHKGKWPEKEDVVSLYFPRTDHRYTSTHTNRDPARSVEKFPAPLGRLERFPAYWAPARDR